MAGCGGGSATTTSVQTSMTTTTTEDDELLNPVDVKDIELDLSQTDINGTVLKYIGCYDLRKAGDIKPAYKYFEETYGATIEIELCSDLAIMDKLATYLSSGQSPDLVDTRDNSFPSYIAKNTYEALDEYMDLSAPQWAGVSQYLDGYAVAGKHYYFPWAYYVNPIFLCYNRGQFEEYGIDDPKELYDSGKWTWDAFYDCMVQFVDKSSIEDAIGLMGVIGTSMINTTGKAAVSYENGQLINNLRSTEVERAQTFLEKVRKEGLARFAYDGGFDNTIAWPLTDGMTAFHSIGDWKITDYAKLMAKDSSLDIFFVPYPRDPSADNYYLTMDSFGYLVPSGSQNIEAACIFINCVRMSVTDEALIETTKESVMKSKKYTEEQYEFYDYFHHPENFDNLVIDYCQCFDSTTMNDVMNPMLEDTVFDRNALNLSWTTMRENYYGLIEAGIETMNTVLTQ